MRLGSKHSDVAKAKMSAAGVGRKQSQEAIEKTRAAQMGHTVSAETRAKISAARKGKPGHPHTDESKAKIGQANRNRSPEVRSTLGPKGRRGPDSHCWTGGEFVDKEGRVLMWVGDRPGARKGGYMYRARLVAEEKIGQVLGAGSVVHHIDRDVANDNPDNLMVFENPGDHTRFHGAIRRAKAAAATMPVEAPH
jgi:hypothetical protein